MTAGVSVLELGLRAMRSVTSVNAQNRIHIGFENRASAIERHELIQHLREDAQQGYRALKGAIKIAVSDRHLVRSSFHEIVMNAEAWLKHLEFHARLAGEAGPPGLHRSKTTKGFALYDAPAGQNREVLVGWSGRSRRLMMPVANYLPALGQLGTDLLLLWPDAEKGYRHGVVGLGDSFDASIAAIKDFVQEQGYTSIRVIGTSQGGLPAVVSAPLLGAESCSVVGFSERSYPEGSGFQRIIESWRRPGVTPPPTLVATVGSTAKQDFESAMGLLRIVQGRLVEVPGEGHSPTWALLRSGTFHSWLRDSVLMSR